MEVLNTALYYTKVCLGFSSKHEKVDIPKYCKGWNEFHCEFTCEEVDLDSHERHKDCPLVEVVEDGNNGR